MGVFKKIAGIVGDFFLLGIGSTAHGIKDHADGVQVTDNAGSASANAVVARPQGANQDIHASTYLDTKERVIDIEFSFNGGAAPAPGTNTGKYGICHTSGGGYSAGTIYLDDGAALTAIPMYKMMMSSPRASFTGTVSMDADALYMAESGAAPWTWTKKASDADLGDTLSIKVPFTFASMGGNVNSTTSIPDGATVIRSSVVVTTPFSGGANPTATVLSHGTLDTTLQATTDNNLKAAHQYDVVDDILIAATHGGPVRVTLGGTATAGVGYALVEYTTPQT